MLIDQGQATRITQGAVIDPFTEGGAPPFNKPTARRSEVQIAELKRALSRLHNALTSVRASADAHLGAQPIPVCSPEESKPDCLQDILDCYTADINDLTTQIKTEAERIARI